MTESLRIVSRRAFVLGAAGVGAALALSGCGSGSVGGTGIAWDVQRDDALPQLCQKAADGSVTTATQDGWAVCDGYIQLQLGGGSNPGIKIKSATGEKDLGIVAVTLDPGDGVSTRDLVWAEFRLVPPTGIDVASVTKLQVDYGDGNAVQLDDLLPSDGTAGPNGRPVA